MTLLYSISYIWFSIYNNLCSIIDKCHLMVDIRYSIPNIWHSIFNLYIASMYLQLCIYSIIDSHVLYLMEVNFIMYNRYHTLYDSVDYMRMYYILFFFHVLHFMIYFSAQNLYFQACIISCIIHSLFSWFCISYSICCICCYTCLSYIFTVYYMLYILYSIRTIYLMSNFLHSMYTL